MVNMLASVDRMFEAKPKTIKLVFVASPLRNKNNVSWWGDMSICMPLSTIFQSYHDGQFYLWRKPEHQEKTTDLLQVTDITLSHHVASIMPGHERRSNSRL